MTGQEVADRIRLRWYVDIYRDVAAIMAEEIDAALAEQREACAKVCEKRYCFTGECGEYNCSTPDDLADEIRALK
jgi:hypothetical protein